MGSEVTAAGVDSPFLYKRLLGILLMAGEAVNRLGFVVAALQT
jgi:hypothetical protein